jgi:1-acyl-sn-glycerol-3-phosphate acyltransferase
VDRRYHALAAMGLSIDDIVSNLRRLASVAKEELPADPLERRDPDFILAERDFLGALCDAWYAPEVMGLEHLPPGRALVVGTHNGGYNAPDMFSLMVATWRAHDPHDNPAYGLAHDMVYRIPWAGRWIAKLGAVPAHPENARLLLERDRAVLVYPGGDRDAYKPFRARHTVTFAGRMGFIRLALRSRAPIVPVISVGAHETFLVLSDGANLARRLGLKKRLRMDVLPIALALPFGLSIGALSPFLPMPTKIRIRVLPAIDLGHGPEAAESLPVVEEIFDRVVATMQQALDALVVEGGFGVKARLM